MTIQFERRTDRPDPSGRCTIHLRVYFDAQRVRIATRERCLTSEWNSDRGQFRRSFAGAQEANEYLHSLTERLQMYYRQLRATGATVTAAALKAALAPVPEKQAAAVPALVFRELYVEYQAALRARGHMALSMESVNTTLMHLTGFEKGLRRKLLLADYTRDTHDKFLAYLRQTKKLAQNTMCKTVKHVKAFLRYVRDDRRIPVAVEPRELKMQWAEVEKVYLSAGELRKLEAVALPGGLGPTRDAFLFCCYTGLRHSDLAELKAANLKTWNNGRILRLTQTKTRTAVSIYLTPPAAALLDKYEGERARLLPAMTNQIMNRNLKRIGQLAGLREMVEVVSVVDGKVLKRQQPKHELVTMHTARHTFAVLSLMQGLPVAVLQKVLGHAKIQTTMLYAKVVEDFQHQEMRRVWEGTGAGVVAVRADEVCAVMPDEGLSLVA